jgi:hypothetical protein
MLFGQPVNVNIAGGGTLPQGKALTILNASFADRTRAKKGFTGPDVFGQVWLLKLRYGITNYIEVNATTPYINNERSPKPANGPRHIEGFGDQAVGFTFALLNEHQGDPAALSFQTALLLPTGNYGKNHLPGNGVWGGRVQAGIGKFFMERRVRLETEISYAGPFDRGNQKVKRGGAFEWNAQARYLFDRFDIGLESNMTIRESGSRQLPNGNIVNLRNGSTEWVVGPSVNVGLDALGMWAGIGVFFPVVQDVRGPSKVEDVRYEFKIGKLW